MIAVLQVLAVTSLFPASSLASPSPSSSCFDCFGTGAPLSDPYFLFLSLRLLKRPPCFLALPLFLFLDLKSSAFVQYSSSSAPIIKPPIIKVYLLSNCYNFNQISSLMLASFPGLPLSLVVSHQRKKRLKYVRLS